MWRRLPSLCLALLLAAPALADLTADRLRQSVSLARANRPEEAADALPPMADAAEEHLALLREAARALQPRRPADALRPLAAILRLRPGDAPARRAAEAAWAANPTPAALRAEALPAVPATLSSWGSPDGSIAVRVLTPRPFLPVPPAQRQGGSRSSPWLGAVYLESRGLLTLKAVVRAEEAVGAETAQRVATLCGALAYVGGPYDAARGRDAGPVRVWLEADGAPGAETTGRDILVRGANGPRKPLEWLRQVSHEWGHAVVPGVGGFREPEPWANGDLGERLFLPALARAGGSGVWGEPADVEAYTERFVVPLREAFATTGPVPSLVADTSRKGFEHFLGAALYVQDAYGTEVLAAALGALAGARTSDFLRAVGETLRGRAAVAVARPAGAAGPRPICIAAKGTHMLRGSGVRVAGKPVTGPLSLPAGWTMADWVGTLTVETRNADRR